MELTDRERRILAELEGQLATEGGGSTPPRKQAEPARQSFRRRWTVMLAAVLGVLLLAAGIALGVSSAVLLGVALLGWRLSPWVSRLLRGAGRMLLKSFRNSPPGAAP